MKNLSWDYMCKSLTTPHLKVTNTQKDKKIFKEKVEPHMHTVVVLLLDLTSFSDYKHINFAPFSIEVYQYYAGNVQNISKTG
jgi:hypothetical protein